MKKFPFIILALLLILVVWINFIKQSATKPLISGPEGVAAEQVPQLLETNLVMSTSNASTASVVSKFSNAIESSQLHGEPINVLAATNLEQWKTAIKDLKPLAGYVTEQHWLVEQPGRKTGLPIILSQGDKTVQYSAVLISINAENDTGNINSIEMQTPNMNIDETRAFGLQLCGIMGLDPADFIAWCSKVENRWLDAPVYTSIGVQMPNSNKREGFGSHMTYNNEKPWFINFTISNP